MEDTRETSTVSDFDDFDVADSGVQKQNS